MPLWLPVVISSGMTLILFLWNLHIINKNKTSQLQSDAINRAIADVSSDVAIADRKADVVHGRLDKHQQEHAKLREETVERFGALRESLALTYVRKADLAPLIEGALKPLVVEQAEQRKQLANIWAVVLPILQQMQPSAVQGAIGQIIHK